MEAAAAGAALDPREACLKVTPAAASTVQPTNPLTTWISRYIQLINHELYSFVAFLFKYDMEIAIDDKPAQNMLAKMRCLLMYRKDFQQLFTLKEKNRLVIVQISNHIQFYTLNVLLKYRYFEVLFYF